jgi:hypothetical protein
VGAVPFHQEKSASFHVDDRKGFYYCFGCHAKGDAVTFIKENENVSFMEAVEILAREAGMQMPARDPQAAQKADRRTQLAAGDGRGGEVVPPATEDLCRGRGARLSGQAPQAVPRGAGPVGDRLCAGSAAGAVPGADAEGHRARSDRRCGALRETR